MRTYELAKVSSADLELCIVSVDNGYSVNRSFTVCHPLTLLGLRAHDAMALHHCLRKVCDGPSKSH